MRLPIACRNLTLLRSEISVSSGRHRRWLLSAPREARTLREQSIMSNRSISRQQCWPAHSGGLLAVYLVILTSTVLVTTAKASPPADLVLRGGKLVTMDAACPIAEAVAVRGGHIVLAGTSDDVAATIGPSTRVIELDGKLAIPGFVEGHGHFLGLGESKMILDLADAATWDEIVQQVAQAARTAPAGTWIVGRGWHQSKWEKLPDPCVEGNPTHAMLSANPPPSSNPDARLGAHVHRQRPSHAVGRSRQSHSRSCRR